LFYSTLSVIINLWKTYQTKREGGKMKRSALINARKNKNMTQDEVALLVGLSLSGYRKIEYNERNPTVKTVKVLIETLGIDLSMI